MNGNSSRCFLSRFFCGLGSSSKSDGSVATQKTIREPTQAWVWSDAESRYLTTEAEIRRYRSQQQQQQSRRRVSFDTNPSDAAGSSSDDSTLREFPDNAVVLIQNLKGDKSYLNGRAGVIKAHVPPGGKLFGDDFNLNKEGHDLYLVLITDEPEGYVDAKDGELKHKGNEMLMLP